ncbi:MAG: hypothetical protein K2X81_26905 [Candidatus Obscuribacterales bacterium]|nr:hypothetical protein [Candidatus Obscuribacterales bacterium]
MCRKAVQIIFVAIKDEEEKQQPDLLKIKKREAWRAEIHSLFEAERNLDLWARMRKADARVYAAFRETQSL